jgi:hypothetical protein
MTPQTLPAGVELRRQIAIKAGWHMRKIWVGSRGIEYDFIIYDNDDRMIYQREITAEDLKDERLVTESVWLEAMADDETPRWEENIEDALWLIDRTPYNLQQNDHGYHAWVGAEHYSATAGTQPLALLRAWLHWAEDNLDW